MIGLRVAAAASLLVLLPQPCEHSGFGFLVPHPGADHGP
jgi:hypothetical protein